MSIKIIAEAGVNHNGNAELAKEMVEQAKGAGADYIKFQTFQPEKLVSRFAQKAEYQKETTRSQESQLDMLKGLALSRKDFQDLAEYCRELEIDSCRHRLIWKVLIFWKHLKWISGSCPQER